MLDLKAGKQGPKSRDIPGASFVIPGRPVSEDGGLIPGAALAALGPALQGYTVRGFIRRMTRKILICAKDFEVPRPQPYKSAP